MVQGKSITAKLGAGIYFRAAARAQSIADTVFFRTRLATVEQDQLLCWAHHHVRFGSTTDLAARLNYVRLSFQQRTSKAHIRGYGTWALVMNVNVRKWLSEEF
jgi:hypothetical protein